MPVTLIDHGRSYPRNIVGVIVHKDLEKDIYKVASKQICVPKMATSLAIRFVSPKTV